MFNNSTAKSAFQFNGSDTLTRPEAQRPISAFAKKRAAPGDPTTHQNLPATKDATDPGRAELSNGETNEPTTLNPSISNEHPTPGVESEAHITEPTASNLPDNSTSAPIKPSGASLPPNAGGELVFQTGEHAGETMAEVGMKYKAYTTKFLQTFNHETATPEERAFYAYLTKSGHADRIMALNCFESTQGPPAKKRMKRDLLDTSDMEYDRDYHRVFALPAHQRTPAQIKADEKWIKEQEGFYDELTQLVCIPRQKLFEPYRSRFPSCLPFTLPYDCYLHVPYDHRDAVKAHGAEFDHDDRRWYIPAGKDLSGCGDYLAINRKHEVRLRFKLDDALTPVQVQDEILELERRGAYYNVAEAAWCVPKGKNLGIL